MYNEEHKSNSTGNIYILNKSILNDFGNIGSTSIEEMISPTRKHDIREYIYNIIISKFNWLERLEKEPNVLEYCLETGLLEKK